MTQLTVSSNLTFDDLGEQQVKNIAKPVRIYRFAGSRQAGSPKRPQIRCLFPDKPSIAVLPFDNMSGDHKQEYFSDGITEDIITELSRFRSLFVIARNSSFTFKGQAVDVTDVGRILGVQYVVEGSVRKAANRVRVTAQLVGAETGNHICGSSVGTASSRTYSPSRMSWCAPSYRPLAAELTLSVRRAPPARAKPTCAPMISICAPRLPTATTKEDYQRARQYLERAIELDPGLAMAHHHLSLVNFFEWMAHWVDDRDMAFAAALNAEHTAVHRRHRQPDTCSVGTASPSSTVIR